MKKILSTLALLLALLTTAGCTVELNGESAQSSERASTPSAPLSTAVTSAPVTSAIPGTTAVGPPETEPPSTDGDTFVVPSGQGEAIEYIPDADYPQLREIAELPSDGVPSDISTWDRYMLVNFCYYAEYGVEDEEIPIHEDITEDFTEVWVLDLLTGEVTASYRYDGIVECGFLENGSVYLIDYSPLSIKVYDRSGVLSYSHLPRSYDQLTVDRSDGGWAWLSTWDGGIVERISLESGEVTTYTLSAPNGSYIQSAVDGSAYLSVFQTNDAAEMYHLAADGSVEKRAGVGGYIGIGDTLYRQAPNGWRYIDLRVPSDRVYCFEVEETDAYVLSADKGRFLVEWCRYDAESMIDETRVILCTPSASSRTEIKLINRYVYTQCWSEDAVYLLINEDSVPSLYLWDYADAPAETLKTSVYTISGQEKANLEYAEQLQNEWGISVYFGEEDMERAPSDYIADPLTDQTLIADSLSELADALGDYPEGFFLELPYGEYDHLEIYLCSGLTPTDSYGINTAIALSNTRGSALVIFLDMTAIDELPQTLAHEILHMMERRIDQIDPTLLADWSSLTPGGDDAYYFSYHDESGDEMNDIRNTWYGEIDSDLIYFVDAYSKSFPTEDRARVFEHLVGGKGDPFFADSPVLMAKAERLCEIIRLTFPSVANADDVAWEVR